MVQLQKHILTGPEKVCSNPDCHKVIDTDDACYLNECSCTVCEDCGEDMLAAE